MRQTRVRQTSHGLIKGRFPKRKIIGTEILHTYLLPISFLQRRRERERRVTWQKDIICNVIYLLDLFYLIPRTKGIYYSPVGSHRTYSIAQPTNQAVDEEHFSRLLLQLCAPYILIYVSYVRRRGHICITTESSEAKFYSLLDIIHAQDINKLSMNNGRELK